MDVEHAANQYATVEEFCRVFTAHMDTLFQLSLLLTGDEARAERCFVAGIKDCAKENHVFREWARSWAKRTIIQNAIRELRPHPCPANTSFSDTSILNTHLSAGDPIRNYANKAVLALSDFERFVFVMSVLEHYSADDCALLLGCSQREVLQARAQALVRLPDSSFVPFPHEDSFEDRQETNG